MLRSLYIRNIAIIDEVTSEFSTGLNLMTGETGAGKSIIIDSLGLVLGNRASTSLIKAGEKSATVVASFDMPKSPQADRLLEEVGIENEQELLFRRQITASGGSRAFLNDIPVNLSTITELSKYLVTIHGQGEGGELLTESGQMQLLDEFAGITNQVNELSRIWIELKDNRLKLETISESLQKRLREQEFLEYQIQEISSAALDPQEEQELMEELSILENSEHLKSISGKAWFNVSESDDSLLSRLAAFEATLEEIASYASEWEEKQKTVEGMRFQVQELAGDLSSFNDSIESNPQRISSIEERLDVYGKLQKKFGRTTRDVLDVLDDLVSQRQTIDSDDTLKQELEEKVGKLQQDYIALAKNISDARRNVIRDFEERVELHLADLAMEKATFSVDISTDFSRQYRNGMDSVTFLLKANPGSAARPLSTVASGGEQSRLMLAIQSVVLNTAGPSAMIFDEVDTGVGGKVAEFIGRKLKLLAENCQILCITHLPQVAAFAKHHVVIEKVDDDTSTSVTLRKVEQQDRIEELARMIGGEVVSDHSRNLAREMISVGMKP